MESPIMLLLIRTSTPLDSLDLIYSYYITKSTTSKTIIPTKTNAKSLNKLPNKALVHSFCDAFILLLLYKVASLVGVEPTTFGLEGQCSIQLSYSEFVLRLSTVHIVQHHTLIQTKP
jgi:hypothetical protein